MEDTQVNDSGQPSGPPVPSVPPVAQPPVPEGDLRVSDSERDATLQTLSRQEERAGQALTAKTRTDLAGVTRDLPAEPAPGPRKTPVRWFVAIMGGDEIDLREAEIDGGGPS